MNSGESPWTEERVAQLAKMAAAGASASAIALAISDHKTVISRNAVCGFVHREKIKLNGRHPARGPERRAKPRAKVKQVRPPLPVRAPRAPIIFDALPPSEPVALKLDLMALNKNTCRWPCGDPREADFGYCGQPPYQSSDYCEFHARLSCAKSAPEVRERRRS